MKRRIIKRLNLAGERLRDAWRVLTRQHYYLFSTNREVCGPENPEVYFDIQWQNMRRQDVYEIDQQCLRLLAEDDECQDVLNQANDILNL